MFERFTERPRKVVVLAQEDTRHFNHNYIGAEHLLLGLLREDDGVERDGYSILTSVSGARRVVVTLSDPQTPPGRDASGGASLTGTFRW